MELEYRPSMFSFQSFLDKHADFVTEDRSCTQNDLVSHPFIPLDPDT